MKKNWLILAAVGLADLLGAIDTTGVNIILPKITSNFKISVSLSQWVVTAHVLAMVSTLMIAGKVCDLIGAK
ncbi:MFS transporter, partial [Patescibacteria group bacterium]|nr:MFS transporter [Patescibacteria group bacterium]